ncbi:MAG: hypothetical protein EBQ92_02960 [Proteobacteria bacterium]|nr:hypothetical protein [Pseudomonadota bacterium]
MNVRSSYYFLICSLGLIISLTAKSIDHQASHTRPVVERPSDSDLKLYLELLDKREKELTAANAALLKNADYSLVKIPFFMMKAAIDGYFASRLVGAPTLAEGAGKGAVMGASKAISERLLSWVKTGGIERLKRLGFNVGILGITLTSNSAVQQDYRWQYGIPIYGSAYSAYLWSENLMNTPELIEKNGNDILSIRKEKLRIRNLLEESSSN